MKVLVAASVVALLAVAVYQVGLLEKPPFEYHDSLFATTPSDDSMLLAIVATSTEANIGSAVERLLTGTKQAIRKTLPDEGKAVAAAAAKLYGSPEGAESLSIGLYLDDPKSKDAPRWAIGWAVLGPSKDELDSMVDEMQTASGLTPSENTMRVVRIGSGPVLKARIPWRNMFTPMIAPMLHWSRLMESYDKSDYKPDDDERSTGCLEIYVTGAGDTFAWIDYVVNWGDDSRQIWDDAFPIEGTKETPKATEEEDPKVSETSKEEQEEPEKTEEKDPEETTIESEKEEEETEMADDTEEEEPKATDEGEEEKTETSEEEGEPEKTTETDEEDDESPEETTESSTKDEDEEETSEEEKESPDKAEAQADDEGPATATE